MQGAIQVLGFLLLLK